MDIVVWGTIGLVEGWISSKLYEKSQRYFVVDVFLGMIGAIIGGYIFYAFDEPRIFGGVRLYSLITALISGVLVLVAAIVIHLARKDPKGFFANE